MIGVISRDCESRAVNEFFELFKTPWEFYVPHRAYDVVVATGPDIPSDLNTPLLVIYNSNRAVGDDEIGIVTESKQRSGWLECDGTEFPVYGDVAVFATNARPIVRRRGTIQVVGMETRSSARQTIRVGYDLFQEVSFLLLHGQPPDNAHVPALEIHISLLRSMMMNGEMPFVEVPPVPPGYEFMACLTHDVDFTGIREHKFDHTMWGFVYRGLVGSLGGALKGREPWSKCWINWKAVFSLPLVYFGLKDDFWLEFDRYMNIEKGLGSTFYFIPFKDRPGTRGSDLAPKRRAAKYDLSKIKSQVRELVNSGCEVGLHGIDAWQDAMQGRAERSRIAEITGQSEIGVRMHWLYFSESSPRPLEEAGFAYDSTFGYNDAVGFRSGTTQAFCPLPAATMLELPLNIQDTALFYPGRMNLSETTAMNACQGLIQSAAKFGGTITVNWHTRSLSPERLWGDFYRQLLGEMKKHRVWFGTAQEIVNWFRVRRALRFEQVEFAESGLRVKIVGTAPNCQIPFLVRVHHPRLNTSKEKTVSVTPAYSDILWKGEAELTEVQWQHGQTLTV